MDREKVRKLTSLLCASHLMFMPVNCFIQQTCPLLLRVFVMDSEHHRPDEFTRKKVPDNELQIYTWYGHDCLAVFSNVMGRADAAGRTSQLPCRINACVCQYACACY